MFFFPLFSQLLLNSVANFQLTVEQHWWVVGAGGGCRGEEPTG